MNNEQESFGKIAMLFVALIWGLIMMCGCTKYPSQKVPYVVGTTPLYFNDIKVDYVPPLTVIAVHYGSEVYGSSNHYFYDVVDMDGRKFECIDYQLTTRK